MKTVSSFDLAVLAAGILAISTAAPMIREADAPALVIAVYRLGIASLPLGLYAAASGRLTRPAAAGEAGLVVLASVFLALHFGFWIASLGETSVMTSVVLVASQPLFVGLASGPVLGERPERGVWIGIALATIGAAVMVGAGLDEDAGSALGAALAIAGAGFAAAYVLAGRRVRVAGSDWLPYVTTVYSLAAVLLLGAVAIAGEPLGGYSSETYVWLVLIALVPQLIGHTAINRSLGYLPAAVIAIAILGEPVGATVLAAVFLDETPGALEVAGAALVLAGVYFGMRRSAGSIASIQAAGE
jgi:drug/metabolite transporter (DMT)-like permease